MDCVRFGGLSETDHLKKYDKRNCNPHGALHRAVLLLRARRYQTWILGEISPWGVVLQRRDLAAPPTVMWRSAFDSIARKDSSLCHVLACR